MSLIQENAYNFQERFLISKATVEFCVREIQKMGDVTARARLENQTSKFEAKSLADILDIDDAILWKAGDIHCWFEGSDFSVRLRFSRLCTKLSALESETESKFVITTKNEKLLYVAESIVRHIEQTIKISETDSELILIAERHFFSGGESDSVLNRLKHSLSTPPPLLQKKDSQRLADSGAITTPFTPEANKPHFPSLKRSPSKAMPRAHLYLDDLIEIVDIVICAQMSKDNSKTVRLSFRVNGAVFSSLDEIGAEIAAAHSFELLLEDRSEPVFKLNSFSASELKITGLTLEQQWLAQAQLRAIYEAKSYRIARAIDILPVWITFCFSIGIWVVPKLLRTDGVAHNVATTIYWSIAWIYIFNSFRRNKVSFSLRKHAKKTQFAHTRSIIWTLVLMVLGAVLSVIFQELWNKYKH